MLDGVYAMSKSQSKFNKSQPVEFRSERVVKGLGLSVFPISKRSVNITIPGAVNGRENYELSPGDKVVVVADAGRFRVGFERRERSAAVLSVVRLDGEKDRVGQTRRRKRRLTKRERQELAVIGALQSTDTDNEFGDDVFGASDDAGYGSVIE